MSHNESAGTMPDANLESRSRAATAVKVVRPSTGALWTGRILTALLVLFLAFDAVAKLLKAAPVLEASAQLEIPERVILGLGVVLGAATLLYAIPQTSILGAVLLTGYLGGAVWTHVRMGGAVFPMVFPVIMGSIVWTALLLREPRLRTILPLRVPPA